MSTSAVSKLKRKEKKNAAAIRRASASSFSSAPDERWLFENRLLIIKLTESAIQSLREVKELPTEHGRARIMALCRDITESLAFTLSEQDIISHVNEYQSRMSYLTVGELLYLRSYFHFVCVDVIADGIKTGTLFRVRDAVKLIFALRDIDFERIYETVSYSESVLIRDPADIYVRCDGETKGMYRRKLAEISRRFRMGEYETAKLILKNAEDSEPGGRARHVGWHIMKYSRHGLAAALYFPALYLVPAAISALLALLAYMSDRTALFFGALLAYLPLRSFLKAILESVFSHSDTPDILPRITLDSIPPEGKTMLLYTVSLSGGDGDRAVFDRLSTYAQAYGQENLSFGILADLPDADEEVTEADGKIISEAERRIDEINSRGGCAFLFFRGRTWSASERRYMGAERKRGAQAELFALLSGEKSALSVHGGDPVGYKYVLALDADTEILFSDLKKLIGTALHPCCEPAISRSSGYPIVTDGYGVIAPVACVSMHDADKRCRYTEYRYAYGGRSEYERSSFSVYSYLFGTGSFCGKGLISVDAYMKTIYGAFPKERILSHDTAEGIRLRCGHASDLRIYDGVPRDYMRERSRAHRWIRGDVQALILLRRGIPSSSGEKYKNPTGITDRLIMFEPVVSAVTSAIRPAAIMLPLIGGTPLGFIIYAASVSDRIYKAASLLKGSYRVPWRRYFSGIPNYYAVFGFEIFFASASSADEAVNSADAVYRAFYRMKFSKRRLLEWKTAASSDMEDTGSALYYIRRMWASLVIGAASLVLPLISTGVCRFILPVYGVLWFLFPIYVHRLGNTPGTVPAREGNADILGGILLDVDRMWRFFEDNVTKKYNYLPPDNVTLQPEPHVAARTSPTNIGMYLLSAVNAHDLGIITADELKKRLTDTLSTLIKLEKWKGHLYNWYDIKTLDVLYPAYVSTVDSGNLIVSLLTVRNAVIEYDGLEKIADMISSLTDGADFGVLYNKKRGLFYIGYNSAAGEYDKNVYDLYSGEILTTSFYAAATGKVPGGHLSTLGRVWNDEHGTEAMLSWSGSVFEYFMPAIFLPAVPGTARYEALAAAYQLQRADAGIINGKTIYGRSESSFYDFDDSVNYSYKAHGCDALSISPDIKDDNVFAPYSLYMLASFDPSAANVISEHRGGELYGKYGFYESVDLTDTRVGDGYGVARIYMSHHIGMSITSASNLALSGINVRRFCADPKIRAALPLLFESVGINRRRSPEKTEIRAKEHIPRAGRIDGSVIVSDSAVISNGREKIVATKSGGIAILDGQRFVSQPISRASSGVVVLLRAGGEVFSCTSGTRSQFSTDGTAISYVNEFVLGDQLVKTELILTVSPSSPTAVFELTLTGIVGGYEILYMFDPVMNTRAAYESAPSYSDLFITSDLHSADSVTYTRKTAPGERETLTVSVVHARGESVTIHTKKDSILPFCYGSDDIASIFDRAPTECGGACVHPVFAAVIAGESSGGTCKNGICVAGGGEAVVVSAEEARIGMAHHLELASALAGADTAAVRCAMELSGAIFGDAVRIVGCEEELKIKYRRDIMWRYGISGDLPIVTVFCCELSSSADTFAVAELIAAKRFLFVSGIRFDLVFVSPGSGYYEGGVGRLRQMIRESGSEHLLGKNNGFFVLDRESFTPEDELIFTAVSCRAVDIGTSHAFTLSKVDPSSAAPAISRPIPKARVTFEDEQGNIIITNGSNETPFSMVYANVIFGTLITNLTCGYSWYANSALSMLSRRHADPVLGAPGETVCLTVDGRNYDLARSADKTTFSRACALYTGSVAGIMYELRVGVDARLPVKLYHLRVTQGSGELPEQIRASLLFTPSAPSVMSGGIITLMSDAAAKVSVFAVSDEIHDSAENLGGELRIVSPFASGECGFVIAAFPGGERCMQHIRDKYRRAELIPEAYAEYERRVNSVLLERAYEGTESFLSGVPDHAAYQAVFVRMLARSGYNQSGGAYGFRDQLQDSIAALYFRPELTKVQILRSCARQYEDGRVQHWWHAFPYGGGLRTRCSDDYMWLPLVTSEYVLATNDTDILTYRIPYLASPPLGEGEGDRYETARTSEHTASVLEHCIAAILSSHERGPHGLPLIGSGDWNDGMNEVGVRGIGESVWLAFFFAVVYRRFSEMLGASGIDPMLAERLMYDADALVSAADMSAWDGGWYVRAFDDDGEALGSERSEECRIDLLPQAFSVFAASDRERSKLALSNVKKHLYDEKLGILRLFAPSYETNEKHGYICRYPAGIRENGGQYTHAAVWCAAAYFAIGERELGRRILSSISPAGIYERGRIGGRYTAEPYFLAADIYYGNTVTGKSGWSGYTGSAAWFYTVTMKYYLGITVSGGAVVVTPPPDISYTASVRVGGCEVTVSVFGGDDAHFEGGEDVFTVLSGEPFMIKPRGDKIKISLKVEK